MSKKHVKIKGLAKTPVSFNFGEIGILLVVIIAISLGWPVALKAVISLIWHILNTI